MAYEAVSELPVQARVRAVQVRYGSFYGFFPCFAQYTGLDVNELGLYEGPLTAAVEWK